MCPIASFVPGRWLLVATAMLASPCAAEVSKNLLTNGSFAEGLSEQGVPVGWGLYGGRGEHRRVTWIGPDAKDGPAAVLSDGHRSAEIGLVQDVPGRGGETYEASVEVRAVEGGTTIGGHLQLRFLPANVFRQVSFRNRSSTEFKRVAVRATSPEGTKRIRLYIYTHRGPTPRIVLRDARLVSGVPAPPPPPPPPPEPVSPVYTQLKDRHLTTNLVAGGRARALIVAPLEGRYTEQAEQIRDAIARLCGVALPIVCDAAPVASVPLQANLIVLGNRSTNRTLSGLYDRFYTLLDLRYPGRGGHIVRTVHNPFGNGRNAVLLGGSDDEGVAAATAWFVEHLEEAARGPDRLEIGRLAEIKLGEGITVPTDIKSFRTWEASAMYRSVGYFGWNSISKRMAMYYMTGEEHHAREFMRLAFPDAQAKREIAVIDGERIENKDDPLAGPYHYNAHMMILFWDLIEESPVFTDEQRLRVTNAFSRQLQHRKGEGIYRRTTPPAYVGTRHGQWSAVSLYCLGRYFNKDYPSPIWAQAMRGAQLHFAPLYEHAWVRGEFDNLFWYATGVAPIFTYMTLTGDRRPMAGGSVPHLLRGLEILATGGRPDWPLESASIGFLHKATSLTGDGRWLAYRDRTGVDLDVFRLGQSFWPGPELEPAEPTDLVGRWSVHPLPEAMWAARSSGLPLEESFQFGSFRSTTDGTGDFVLIDGYNGAVRNPYHTFAITELRLDGHTLLKGYHNQVITRDSGMVASEIAMDAALKDTAAVGEAAICRAEVPDASYCSWQRTLVQRVGRYALIVDDLTFHTDSETMQVELTFETTGRPRKIGPGHVRFEAVDAMGRSERKSAGHVICCDPLRTRCRGKVATMMWTGPVRKGQRKVFITLVGRTAPAGEDALACCRSGQRGALLALPEPAFAMVEPAEGEKGSVLVMSGDHCFGHHVRRLKLMDAPRMERCAEVVFDGPADALWDLKARNLHVNVREDTQVKLALLDGNATPLPMRRTGHDQERTAHRLSPGRHELLTPRPEPGATNHGVSAFKRQLASAIRRRKRAAEHAAAGEPTPTKALKVVLDARVPGAIVDLKTGVTVAGGGQARRLIFVAEGKTIHALTPTGEAVRTMATDGPIRMLRWWPEHGLLLAGCADEKVIAFGADGRRRWTFVSTMHPDVFRAAKTYWFKSAPGHEGIHGLDTGVFLDGKSQCFVGSACTLEILDDRGKLLHRLPQFWGTVSHFAIVHGPGGSLNLLASRKYNGTNRVAIINNKTLDPRPRGFHGVPAGSTYVSGWSAMNRYHLLYEDLNGDGTKEVVSEINGFWNRVTVWDAQGKPLYDASFGPGQRISSTRDVRNMRDVAIADLCGDAKKEIVVGIESGLVVALDHQCKKVWARRLDAPPLRLACVRRRAKAGAVGAGGSIGRKTGQGRWVVVACEDGTVLALDGSGRPRLAGTVEGRAERVAVVAGPEGDVVWFGTTKGHVKGFTVPPASARTD